MRRNVLALSLGLLATVALSQPAFSQSANGLGVGVSVGGPSGLNANVGLGGSNGLKADIDASLGGANGVNANATPRSAVRKASTPMCRRAPAAPMASTRMPMSALAAEKGSTLRSMPRSVDGMA